MSDHISPLATIGIIGGGQLGRMIALAAARLGYRSHVFCPEINCPASHVALTTTATYEDQKALINFANNVDVVTFEFENIPLESVSIISKHIKVHPNLHILEISQNRLLEKSFLNSIDVATVNWYPVKNRDDLENAVITIGKPSVLKTARFGYDGKGQIKIDTLISLDEAWNAINGAPAILESFIDFKYEVSIIVACSSNGTTRCFDVTENRHRDHILYKTIVPAPITKDLVRRIEKIAIRIAKTLNLVGLLAVELFVTLDDQLLVNELAPRPHNSGHWTIDVCVTDQFEQLIRAICGLPLGSTQRHSNAIMTNLIGNDVDQWLQILHQSNAHLHLYGKKEIHQNRKMGHVTQVIQFNNKINPIS
ncbi:MAG: 5-(carboxyamino)imidazole ribonucleotide synthase [Rhodospirillaceae bacterium]|jgi:5-(carboxyamino)imidazole ribonucleotide synthase|nr:5-(carboxyamino)imidazole ribonucleotide synthase [Rhodospirillaceae bacterium]